MNQFVKIDIVQYLQEPQKTFLQYFPEEMINCNRVHNLFSCSTAPFTVKTMKKFIELSSNGNLNKSIPEQRLNKCSKCISYTCIISSEETFAFGNYLPM